MMIKIIAQPMCSDREIVKDYYSDIESLIKDCKLADKRSKQLRKDNKFDIYKYRKILIFVEGEEK